MERQRLPTGTVTFLFTDVEGSTKLLHQLGAETYAEVLAEHRRIVRATCAGLAGVEVDTQGDAFFYAFPRAPDALEAAKAIVEDLAPSPMSLRVGLHTGTPLVTNEGYVGDDIHRAARIAAAGHGGQILVSASTAALVSSELHDLGDHRLKDLSGPERLFQLGAQKFPPLSTLYQTNLPVPATPFVAREKQLDDVRKLLSRDDVRLLTLTGPGGTGKTRLAAQGAGALSDRYEHGVWWVPLAPLRDPALVLEAAAHAVGARGDLTDHLGDKRLLLLFDNFEHVIAAAPGLAALLAGCPNIQLLVTSRERLHLSAEYEYPVPPFDHQDAITFFVARARAVRPDFDTNGSVSEICRRLEGLPLALELAAARVKTLSAMQMLARLERQLPLLTGGSRDIPEHQRTLQATIEWSFDLLSLEEQLLLLRLSAFVGGCTLEAAEEVARATLDGLQSLAEKSLLRSASERYWMLETIREYAIQRLEDTGDADEVCDRHAEYFLSFAKREGPLIESRSQAEARARLADDAGNLRFALSHISQRHPARVLEFVSALADYWMAVGQIAEIRHWTQLALESSPDELTVLRADALLLLGVTSARLGDELTSVQSTLEAIEIYRDRGSARLGRALVYLGSAYLRAGRYQDARSVFDDALTSGKGSVNEWARALALSNLGYLALILGDYALAEEMSLESVALKQELGNEVGVAEALCNAGLAALLASRLDDAQTLLRETARAGLAIGHETLLACCLEAYAWMAAQSEDLERAAVLQGAAETLMERVGGSLDTVEQRLHDETRELLSGAVAASPDRLALGRELGAAEAVAYALQVT